MERKDSEHIPNVKDLDVELLGKPIHIIREKLEALIADSCTNLTYALQNWLNTTAVEARLNSVELYRFSSTSLNKDRTSTYKHQDNGLVYVDSDASTLIKLADRFYGARIERSTTTLTTSDVRLQERIGRLMTGWLAPLEMWRTCEFEAPRDIGLCVTLTIQYKDHQGAIQLKLDNCLIQALTEQLDLQPTRDLYVPFCHSLFSVPVRLNVVLSKKTIALSDVANLQPGDILPIELLNTVPVSIGNHSLFTGRIAEQEGQLVLIFNQDKESHR